MQSVCERHTVHWCKEVNFTKLLNISIKMKVQKQNLSKFDAKVVVGVIRK